MWQRIDFTFNCGIGMVLLVTEESADTICQALAEADEAVHRLGRVIQCSDTSQRVSYIRS